jgi:hypothetical protein
MDEPLQNRPEVSFVACGRNDDHGGNFLARFEIFVRHLAAQCARHALRAELVVVEWNPPKDKAGLRNAIKWPAATPFCPVRLIQVPKELHERFENSDKLLLHQFIAKNAGIRRARGEFIVATNIDIIFSDALIARMAKGHLQSDCFYRVDRRDVSPMVPLESTASEQLQFCERNVIRIHDKFGTLDLRHGTFSRIYRRTAVLLLASWSFPIGLIPFAVWSLFAKARAHRVLLFPDTRDPAVRASAPDVPGTIWGAYCRKVAHARRSMALRRLFGYLHTNACGDFTLMARTQWERLMGYVEFPGFPMHIDGLLLYAAKAIGMKEEVWNASAFVYHMEHDDGSGFNEYASGEKWRSLESRKIPYIAVDEFIRWALDMGVGNSLPMQNDKNWGMPDVPLPEKSPSS